MFEIDHILDFTKIHLKLYNCTLIFGVVSTLNSFIAAVMAVHLLSIRSQSKAAILTRFPCPDVVLFVCFRRQDPNINPNHKFRRPEQLARFCQVVVPPSGPRGVDVLARQVLIFR